MPCTICGQDGHSASSCTDDQAKFLRGGGHLDDQVTPFVRAENLELVYLAALDMISDWAAGGGVFNLAFGDLTRALKRANEDAYWRAVHRGQKPRNSSR